MKSYDLNHSYQHFNKIYEIICLNKKAVKKQLSVSNKIDYLNFCDKV